MAERVSTAYHSPGTLVPFRWTNTGTVYVPISGGTAAAPFSITSQNPNTLAWGPWYATGRAGIDGNFTVALTNGFTPPITLTVWEYNRAASAWFLLGSNAGLYTATFDALFTQSAFQAAENAVILIQSSAVITGNAYIDGLTQDATVGAPLERLG